MEATGVLRGSAGAPVTATADRVNMAVLAEPTEAAPLKLAKPLLA